MERRFSREGETEAARFLPTTLSAGFGDSGTAGRSDAAGVGGGVGGGILGSDVFLEA